MKTIDVYVVTADYDFIDYDNNYSDQSIQKIFGIFEDYESAKYAIRIANASDIQEIFPSMFDCYTRRIMSDVMSDARNTDIDYAILVRSSEAEEYGQYTRTISFSSSTSTFSVQFSIEKHNMKIRHEVNLKEM